MKRNPVHIIAEWAIRAAAVVSVAAIVLIFVFVFREAIPSTGTEEGPSFGELFVPKQWPGYDEPVYVWQPVGPIPKYNLVPLMVGSFKVTVLAMLVSTPLGLASAAYLSFYASRRTREIVKPIIELLAGVPSVVLGFLALMLLADWVHDIFGFDYRLNGVTAALALSLMIVPVIFTVSEDALSSTPRSLIEAGRALGARTHQLVLRVAMPHALSGIVAALVLGFGRAVGETMVVLMASGNAAVVDLTDWSTSVRTMTATIAAELGEVPRGEPHWRVLFLVGTILFIITFILNSLARWVVSRAQDGGGR